MLNNKQHHNLNQKVTDTIHAVILMKYHKYPPTTILKHTNVLYQVRNLTFLLLSSLMSYKIFTVIHSTYEQLPYQKLVAKK